MKLSWVKALGGFFLAALLSAPAFGASSTALPGTLNFVEGQASIQDQPVTSKSVGTAELQAGQTISTTDGRAEVLLTPGVFLRLGHNTAVKMISPDITNTRVQLEKGRAEIEVAELFKQNDILVQQGDATTRLLKKGLYDFSAGQDQVRVFKGQAEVTDGDKQIKVDQGHALTLDAPRLKSASFNKKDDETGLYDWSMLRSEYLSEASANAAQTYVAGGPAWVGPGWYWDPWFYDYTFLPGAGFLYSPFGPWGFYSPAFVYSYGPGFYYGTPLYWYGPRGFPRYGIREVVPPQAIGRVGVPHEVTSFRGARGFTGPAFRAGSPSMFREGGFHGGFGGGFHGGGFRR